MICHSFYAILLTLMKTPIGLSLSPSLDSNRVIYHLNSMKIERPGTFLMQKFDVKRFRWNARTSVSRAWTLRHIIINLTTLNDDFEKNKALHKCRDFKLSKNAIKLFFRFFVHFSSFFARQSP